MIFFFSSRRRHTRCSRDWSSDVCSSDLNSTICRARLCTVQFRLNAVEFCGGPSGIRWQNVKLDLVGFECEMLKSPAFFRGLDTRDFIAGDIDGVMTGFFKPV